MEFTSRQFVDTVVATPSGRIDQSTASGFQQSLMGALSELPPGALVLDFSGVDYISSAGLRVVMLAARDLRARSARIAVASLQPMVREIFEISRFHHVVDIHPTPREAICALAAGSLAAFDAAAGGAPT